jgi:Carboxypeptidase regulatory-like domain
MARESRVNRNYKTSLGPGALLCFLALVAPLDVNCATLAGTVTGAAGHSKALVRVDARGPQQRVTVTDSDGKFALGLPAGTYTIEIREGNRVVQFSVSIPDGNAPVKRNFALPW